MRLVTKGKCGFCLRYFSGQKMDRHLLTCKQRKALIEAELSFVGRIFQENIVYLLKIYAGPYWLFIEVDGSATLEDIDSFLREIWLECCGHLSCFTIDGKHYYIKLSKEVLFSPPKIEERDMKVKLTEIFRPRLEFEHEYDFGTTTHLKLKVISMRKGKLLKYPIQLISRNDPITFKCVSCGKVATAVCTECIWEKEPWFCENCLTKHKCGEEMGSPIVNSPRVGMCGYVGGLEDKGIKKYSIKIKKFPT